MLARPPEREPDSIVKEIKMQALVRHDAMLPGGEGPQLCYKRRSFLELMLPGRLMSKTTCHPCSRPPRPSWPWGPTFIVSEADESEQVSFQCPRHGY